MTRTEKWYVVKVDTNNGIRLGVVQFLLDDLIDGFVPPDILGGEYAADDAASIAAYEFSEQIGIPVFDETNDIFYDYIEKQPA